MSTAAKQVEVKERPILFSAPMVRAILDGNKTQTRRVITPQPIIEISRRQQANRTWHVEIEWKGSRRRSHGYAGLENGDKVMLESWAEAFCPYGSIGDRLWVRETHGIFSVDLGTVSVGYKERLPKGKTLADTDGGLDVIRVTPEQNKWAEDQIDNERWRPSIFMPRWASRITLQITNIRVERLQDISAADAKAEGIEPFLNRDSAAWRAGFQLGWNEINAKRGYPWANNPFVWAITFKKL